MKVTKTVGDLTIEVEGETQKDIFKALAGAEEVFGENTCGKMWKHEYSLYSQNQRWKRVL